MNVVTVLFRMFKILFIIPTDLQPKFEGVKELIKRKIDRPGIEMDFILQGSEIPDRKPDLIAIIGGDREFLKCVQSIKFVDAPIIGLCDINTPSFYCESSVETFNKILPRIINKDYALEKAVRLLVRIDGKPAPPALNDVCIFPVRSATLMEYTFSVNGNILFRDYSDGIIIATPMGSSAYAMSAGGPLVLSGSDVLVVVSVNSMDAARRPLIIPANSFIEIYDMSSRYEREVIIDGIFREKVIDKVEIEAGSPINIVRLKLVPERLKTIREIHKIEKLMKIPPSARLILKSIEYEGPLSQIDIVKKTGLSPRTVRHALSILLRRGMISKKPDVRDLRRSIYYIITKEKEHKFNEQRRQA
ncbi:MAG: MarR family transcriptional regulator [Thermoprotei archaeon]